MSPLADFLADPRSVLWACFVNPFAMRFGGAGGTPWIRSQTVQATKNLQPRRMRSGFPSPNDLVAAGAVFGLVAVVAAVLSGPVSSWLARFIDESIVWPGLFAITAVGSVS